MTTEAGTLPFLSWSSSKSFEPLNSIHNFSSDNCIISLILTYFFNILGNRFLHIKVSRSIQILLLILHGCLSAFVMMMYPYAQMHNCIGSISRNNSGLENTTGRDMVGQ